MKKLTVRNLLVVIVSLAMAHAMAASASIGIATAKGSFRVDDSYVAGNTTLFDGASVETGAATGELNLSKAKVSMASETRGRVFQDRLVLDRGKVQWGGSEFRTLAGEYQVVGAANNSKAIVVRVAGAVQVASLSGTVNVMSTSGEMVMAVAAGSAYEFTPEPQGASPGTKKDPTAPVKHTVKTLSVGAKVGIGLAVAAGVGIPVGVAASRGGASR